MNNTNSLAATLAARNAATLAWVAEDPDNRFAMTLVEDLAHWAEMGVTTAEELDHYLLVSEVYEGTREAWGYKPSWSALMAESTEDLQRMADSNASFILSELEREEREQRAHERAVSDALTPSSGWLIGDLVNL